MRLTHKFTRRATDEEKLSIASAGSLSAMVKVIAILSEKKDPNRYKPDNFKGDAFEWFAEFFFKTFGNDNFFLNVNGYQPNKGADYGVDGFGKYSKDTTKSVAVQIKYKSNLTKVLSSAEDNLSNFGLHANAKYGVEIDEKYLIVFTSGKGIAQTTQKGIFNDKVTCINGEIIKRYIDTNESFWEEFQKRAVTVKKVAQGV